MMKKIFFGLIISYSWTLSQDLTTVNHKRLNDHMAALSKFGRNDIGGVRRVASVSYTHLPLPTRDLV